MEFNPTLKFCLFSVRRLSIHSCSLYCTVCSSRFAVRYTWTNFVRLFAWGFSVKLKTYCLLRFWFIFGVFRFLCMRYCCHLLQNMLNTRASQQNFRTESKYIPNNSQLRKVISFRKTGWLFTMFVSWKLEIFCFYVIKKSNFVDIIWSLNFSFNQNI